MYELTERLERAAFFYAVGRTVTLGANLRVIVDGLIGDLYAGPIQGTRHSRSPGKLITLVGEYIETMAGVHSEELDSHGHVFDGLARAAKYCASAYDHILPLPAKEFEDAAPGRRWALTASTNDSVEPPEDAVCLGDVTMICDDMANVILCLEVFKEMGVGNSDIPGPRPEKSDLLRPIELADRYARMFAPPRLP